LKAVNLLEVKNLKKYFTVKKGIIFSRDIGYIKAVDNVSFSIREGETLGLVGESGCGKTTTGRVIIRLLPATSGEVYFDGENIFNLKGNELQKLRRKMQIIFQDPYASLNPRMTAGEIVVEPLIVHKLISNKKEKIEKARELLEMVGLNPYHINCYPHEFSGGQRQRIGVARALALNPKLIIADEPVSALDVSIQAQIINLLQDLQEKFNLTYLFIAHDLSVVKHISNRIAVMYLGKIVELALSDDLYRSPMHPYTQALLSAIPIPDPEIMQKREKVILTGDVPSPMNPPSGCYFHPRCNKKIKICSEEEPLLKEIAKDHLVACHLLSL